MDKYDAEYFKETKYLEDPIYNYIKNTDKKMNCHEIIDYIGLRVDFTFKALKGLELLGRIKRHDGAMEGWNGRHYYEAL